MIATKQEVEAAEYLLLVVSGGIGRNICATAVVRNLKKAYPDKKIVVMAGCPEIFLKNPHIDRVHNLGQPQYVFEDYFQRAKTVAMDVEPYRAFGYINRTRHFTECWCDLLDIPCDSTAPELYWSDSERRMAQLFVDKFDKELVLFQPEGGKPPDTTNEKDRLIALSTMYKRSLKTEVIQGVADELAKREYTVGMVGAPNQFMPAGAERLSFPVRAIAALAPYAELITIDSLMNHAAAAGGRKALVLWGGTDPKVLGYSTNENLVRAGNDCFGCHRPNSYLWDIEPNGYMWDCPKDSKCMDFTVAEIMAAFDKITGGRHGRKREERGTKAAGCPGKCAGNAAGT